MSLAARPRRFILPPEMRRLPSPMTSRAACRFLLALTAVSLATAHADVTAGEDGKPGFIKRMFGGGAKETPPAPAEVKEAPKAKPAEPSSAKREKITIKPKTGSVTKSSSGSSKSGSSTPKKSTPAKPAPLWQRNPSR